MQLEHKRVHALVREWVKILKIDLPKVSFKLTCSKGTYVRQLAADIGQDLGCGAYLSRLIRTRSGRFGIDGAVSLDDLKNFKNTDLEKRLNG